MPAVVTWPAASSSAATSRNERLRPFKDSAQVSWRVRLSAATSRLCYAATARLAASPCDSSISRSAWGSKPSLTTGCFHLSGTRVLPGRYLSAMARLIYSNNVLFSLASRRGLEPLTPGLGSMRPQRSRALGKQYTPCIVSVNQPYPRCSALGCAHWEAYGCFPCASQFGD